MNADSGLGRTGEWSTYNEKRREMATGKDEVSREQTELAQSYDKPRQQIKK